MRAKTRTNKLTDEHIECLSLGGDSASPADVESMAIEVKYLRQRVRSALFSIRGWITCQFPIYPSLDQLADDTTVNGVRAGPLKSAKLTCDEVISEIDGGKKKEIKRKGRETKLEQSK